MNDHTIESQLMSTNQIYNEVELLALLKLTSDFPFCTESEDTKTSTTEVIVFALICQTHITRQGLEENNKRLYMQCRTEGKHGELDKSTNVMM